MEMLATLLLIALIMPTAMRGLSTVTHMAARSKRHIEAATLARTKLSELIATEEWQGGSLKHGRFDSDDTTNHEDYEWSWDIRSWDVSPLQELTVTVTWESEQQGLRLLDEAKGVTLSTLVFTSEDDE